VQSFAGESLFTNRALAELNESANTSVPEISLLKFDEAFKQSIES
jgi:hypothetical protein